MFCEFFGLHHYSRTGVSWSRDFLARMRWLSVTSSMATYKDTAPRQMHQAFSIMGTSLTCVSRELLPQIPFGKPNKLSIKVTVVFSLIQHQTKSMRSRQHDKFNQHFFLLKSQKPVQLHQWLKCLTRQHVVSCIP